MAESEKEQAPMAMDRAEAALGTFAEDLGRLLGTAQAKASSWLDQRKAIADELTRIRDAANAYLQQLTGANASAAARRAPVRRGGAGAAAARRKGFTPPAKVGKTKRGSRKGRTLSEETKAKMRAAQQARWARKRGEGGSS
jgi:hypothetical protein